MADGIVKIYLGEDRTLNLSLQYADDVHTPFDLTGATEITAKFPGPVTKTMTGLAVTVVEAKQGKITVALSDTDTNALTVGAKQTFQVQVDIGTVTRIAKFEKLLTVEAQPVT